MLFKLNSSYSNYSILNTYNAFNMRLREITDTNVSEQYEKKELPIL